jgi:hypothetical protein
MPERRNRIADARLAEELRKLFDPGGFDHPAAVSLTMKKRVRGRSIDMMIASENFRHFSKPFEQ